MAITNHHSTSVSGETLVDETRVTSTQIDLSSDQLEALRRADERSDRRLALLVFMATLAANLLGLFASIADASDLIVPILDIVSPMPVVQVAGSNTILGNDLGLARAWEEEFQALTAIKSTLPLAGQVERTINVSLEPIGTLAGIELAQSGQVHLLAASEPLLDSDWQTLAEAGIEAQCAAHIGYDVIVFITNRNNVPPRALTIQEITAMLEGTITDWSQVEGLAGPVRVLARQGSGTTDLVLRSFLGGPDFPPHFIPCDSQRECLDYTLSTPGALYWVSAAWLQTQPRSYLRPLLIESEDGEMTDPLSKTFDPALYPADLVRPLYLYVLAGDALDARSSEIARQFLLYVRGVNGQQTLEEYAFYTYFTPQLDTPIDLPPGFGARPDGLPVVCR